MKGKCPGCGKMSTKLSKFELRDGKTRTMCRRCRRVLRSGHDSGYTDVPCDMKSQE
jgi:phage FluMu protein Com